MLHEMHEFAERSGAAATEWSEARETAFTEELDSHLRAHRCGIKCGGSAQM